MQTTTDPIEIAAKILTAYVARNSVPATSLPDLIRTVHGSITGLTTPPKPVLTKPTDTEIRKSISPDAIISFEDGKPYKALRRHLTQRGLSPEAYRAKWGLPVDYPFVSPSYSARRSLISRTIGQNQRLRFQQAAE
ncbi:MucR family transcriptional regulator [Methylobacterium sp. WL8]|uniref:MucR family transcriptional regulator n=1 Tax=Methylobacterium sp. WL8 TaxID=2603899 RepID=UPI0011C99229|nr:MucR family transcriptional regulator [Methylobacterium sp. WL8]TXN15117.1 MucR family transcriptional regulator [Methylobacterium sp. WL122]TXN77319.1 MucR family transcriptional regulator [Methylobacterium sp. WL8]